MNTLTPAFALALALSATLLTPACDRQTAHAQPIAAATTAAPAAPVVQPTNERIIERSTERWSKIGKGDWIAAYDYLSPEQKKANAIGTYLQNKAHHKYENAQVLNVLQNDGKTGILRVTCMWTPVHELIKTVKLEPGQSLTQEVEMYETWRWAEGDWTYMRAQRPDDFFQEHPELLKATPPKTANAEEPASK